MRRLILIALACGLVLAAAAAFVSFYFLRPTTLRVAVARDTDDHKLIGAVARVLSTARESVRLRVVPVNSAAASAAALQAEDVDLAIVRSDIALPPNGQTLAILHRNPALLISRGDSKVESVAQLGGRKIGVVKGVASGTGNSTLLDLILAQYEVPLGAVERISLERREAVDALRAGRIDAAFVVGPVTSDTIGDLVAAASQAGGVSFIPISEARAIAQRAPALESFEIVRGAFGGAPPRPAATFETLGVSARLMARASLKDSVAGDVTRLLFTERLAIAQLAPLAHQIEAPTTTKGAALPVHPGAAAYLDDEEKSFFDKYSDFIYIGAMLLSVAGSALAAFASRVSAVSHSEFDRLLERLLEILKTARAAATPAELDKLEAETDEILVEGVANRRIHGLDGHGMAALALALDQARRAIRERRGLVERTPAPGPRIAYRE